MSAEVFIVSLGALISHKKNYSMIAQHLYGLNLILNLDSDFNGKCSQKQNILKKALSDGHSANLSPRFNSNMAKVSVK